MLFAHLKSDYDVYEASDGFQAVEAVKKQFYDLVIMDIRMPGMDGLAALRKIKAISPGIVVFYHDGVPVRRNRSGSPSTGCE